LNSFAARYIWVFVYWFIRGELLVALKDLIASKATLAEEAIEMLVSEYVRYDVDQKEITLTPAGTALPAKAKILIYLVALQGWSFLVQEAVSTDASPGDVSHHLGIAGGTVRPMLTDLRDRHLLVVKQGRYSVRASSLSAVKVELARAGTTGRSSTSGRPKNHKKAKEANGSPTAKRRGASSHKSGTLTNKFDGWIDDGFFNQPRTLAEVQKKFRQAGIIVPRTSIPAYLLKAVRSNRLSREEAEVAGKNVWVYQRVK
jgi:hypothetical protein